MELSHEDIMDGLYLYKDQLDTAMQESKEAAVAFVKSGREQEAITKIDDQSKRVNTLRGLMNTLTFLQGPRTSRKRPPAE
jgi:hypothetical protein